MTPTLVPSDTRPSRLAPLAKLGLVDVGLSITTLDGAVSRAMEPRAPAPERRLLTLQRLSASGIPVRVQVSPVVPALTDHEVEAIMGAIFLDSGFAQAAAAIERLYEPVLKSVDPKTLGKDAKTLLQECANELRSEPPQYSPLAFWMSTPSIVARSVTSKVSLRLTALSCRAPARVMILNVEPGGWGAE